MYVSMSLSLSVSWCCGAHTDRNTGAGKGLACIRAASADTLVKANKHLITSLVSPRSGPGPCVDGTYVPDLPQALFAQGRFHKDITVLTTDDDDEVRVPPCVPFEQD